MPFTVVLFDDADEGRMVATIFDSDRGSPRCAVLRVSTLAQEGGTVAFGVMIKLHPMLIGVSVLY